jgi:tetratricopeptide (TPR) repeat protein
MDMRVVGLLLVLLTTPAFAQSAEVKKYFNTAITLYENLEYEKALKQLKAATQKAKGPDDEAKIALLEGVVLADMGREEKALTAFKTAFSVDLEAKLPVEVSPKVQAVAEKARANVRKMLAPQIEAAKVEEEKRLAEEKKRADEEAARVAEQRRVEAEERAKNQPPPAVVTKPAGPSVRGLSWIPGVVGLASAGVATGLLLSANGKYTALVKGTATTEQAAGFRDSGKIEATLGYVFIGVAVAGIGAAVTMFAIGGNNDAAPTVSAVPLQGGGYVSMSWKLDLGGSR